MQPINSSPPTAVSLIPSAMDKPTVDQQKAKLKDQVESFASLLYAQMFEEMRKSGKEETDEEGGLTGGGDTDMFMHFLDESVGKNFMHQGGGSLGDALYRQLATKLETQPGGGAK